MKISSYISKSGFLTFALLMIVSLSGCKRLIAKIDKAETTVYASGYTTGSQGKQVATYWKDDKETKLTTGAGDAVAQSIFVAGNDIYAVGYDECTNGNKAACKWLNGHILALTDGSTNAVANKVLIQNKVVYIAGSFFNANSRNVAAYWADKIDNA